MTNLRLGKAGGKTRVIEIWAGLAWSHSFVLSFQRQNKAMRKSETKTSVNLFLGDKEKERKVAKRIAEVRPAHISPRLNFPMPSFVLFFSKTKKRP